MSPSPWSHPQFLNVQSVTVQCTARCCLSRLGLVPAHLFRELLRRAANFGLGIRALEGQVEDADKRYHPRKR
eukprot:5628006-Pyramimonas_sp.AAC.2